MIEAEKKVAREESKLTGLDYSFLLIVIVFLSCTYDYFYYFKLGFIFFQIPTSLSDHYRSSLDWMPDLILLLIFCIFFEPSMKIKEFLEELRINKSKFDKENIKKIDYFTNLFRRKHFPSFKERGFRLLIFSLILLFLLIYFGYEKLPQPYLDAYPQLLGIASVMGYNGLYVLVFYNFHQRNSIFNSKQIKIFNIIFSFFIFFAVTGFNTAEVELFKAINSLSRTLEYSTKGHTTKIGILKNLEKGIFGINMESRKFEFYTWEELKKVTYFKPQAYIKTTIEDFWKIEHKQPEKK